MTIEFDSIGESGESPPRAGRNRRVAAGLAGAMLVAAAGGVGFGIGRNVDRGEQVVSPAAQEPIGTEPASEPASERSVEAATEPAAESADTVSNSDAPADGVAQFDVASSGGGGWSSFGDQNTELLFDRTTDAELIVRAHLGQVWGPDVYAGEFGPNQWQPPAWCYESGQVRLALGGQGLIDVGSVSWYAEPYHGRAVSWVTLGRADDNPHRVVFVQTPPDTTLVTVTFGDGAVDSVAPQNGVAVLVVPGAPTTLSHDEGDYVWLEEVADFVVTFDDGIDTFDVASTGVGTWDDPEFQASCSPPPPALPEPGEQPAEAEAVEAEIVALMSAIYGPDDSLLDALAFIDDPTGVAEAREEVRGGSLEESAASAEAVVEELVFTAATEAWFRYRIETINGTFGERYGIAVLIDGVWKITQDTICQDLSMAGGSCGSGRVIRPPGFEYDDFDEGMIID